MSDAWIGIGANLGEPRAAFDTVWQELHHHPDIRLRQRSGIYHTSPVGMHAGSTFSNAVFSLSTTLRPLELLDLLQSIETGLGRTRDVRWGPRPIDLDLLFIGEQVLNDPRLTLPHPAAWYRRFVLDPLFELAPGLRHPVLGLTIAELRELLAARPLFIQCQDPVINALSTGFQAKFPDVRIVAAELNSPATIGIRLSRDELHGESWRGIPVADLSTTPGDAFRRVSDFLTSVIDEPRRISDWSWG